VELQKRGEVEDDTLPVAYSILDGGESMIGGLFGKPIKFYHRDHYAAYSKAEEVVQDYSTLPTFSKKNEWFQRFLSIQKCFEKHMGDCFGQHPCLTMDALNFVVEMRGTTSAYLDLYEHPEEIRLLLELGLKFNIAFQDAQRKMISKFGGGCFEWLCQWVPFENAVSLSVDAYAITSVEHYVEYGFDYQRRLIEHFGHGFLHFHCTRADLAKEVIKLPGLELFQFGDDPKDKTPNIDHLPEMREIVGDVPMMIKCRKPEFVIRLDKGELMPNVWYYVGQDGENFTKDEANRLMDRVRAYRA
jgi:hypothetical protein